MQGRLGELLSDGGQMSLEVGAQAVGDRVEGALKLLVEGLGHGDPLETARL